MGARAIWKGVLQLGTATVPVKLYSAVEDRAVHFHLLEARTHSRVKQHMVNPETGKEVPKDEIRKGYEIEQDTFVILDDEELKAIEPEASRDIEVKHFLPEDSILHQWYERPYYLGPDGEDDDTYFALAQALQQRNSQGLAQWVMRGKQYIGALRERDGYLLLIRLRYVEEVLTARDLQAPGGRAPDPREIKMAEQLVAVLQDEFRPEDFRDEYRDRVMSYIEAKAKGQKPKLATMPSKPQPKSLTDMLQASLNAAKRGKGDRVA